MKRTKLLVCLLLLIPCLLLTSCSGIKNLYDDMKDLPLPYPISLMNPFTWFDSDGGGTGTNGGVEDPTGGEPILSLAYESNGDGTCSVVGMGNITDKIIVIPATSPAGDTVTAVGENAFQYSNLTSVTLPETVTSIGALAFASSYNLTTVAGTEKVTYIASGAFLHCRKLSGFTLASNLHSLGESAFSGCYALDKITIPESLKTIKKEVFKDCTGLSSITISNGVREIGKQAFEGCTTLKKITIPDSVTKIAERAFYNCESLEDVVIGKGVTGIEKYVFQDCKAIKSLTLPFPGGAASGEKAYLCYLFGGRYAQDNPYTIPTTLKKVTITSATTIPARAFQDCTMITSVTLPAGLKTIEEMAFSGCSALTSIEIPEGVTTIGQEAFENCTKLSSIKLPNSATNLGRSLFAGCSRLAKVTLPSNLKTIPTTMFFGCAIKEIILPKSIKTIGESAFANCANLKTIYFEGTPQQWGAIVIEWECFNNAGDYSVLYYSETTLNLQYNYTKYWRYENGKPKQWGS